MSDTMQYVLAALIFVGVQVMFWGYLISVDRARDRQSEKYLKARYGE